MIVTFELFWISGDVINGFPTTPRRITIPTSVDPIIAPSDAIDDIPSGSHFFSNDGKLADGDERDEDVFVVDEQEVFVERDPHQHVLDIEGVVF